MKSALAALFGVIFVTMAFAVIGEEKNNFSAKNPFSYQIGEVKCTIVPTKLGFRFKADGLWAEGRTVHEVEIDRKGALLSSVNYRADWKTGKMIGEKQRMKYPMFYAGCLRRIPCPRKAEDCEIQQAPKFPASVAQALGGRPYSEIFNRNPD